MLDHANKFLDIDYMLNWVTVDYNIPCLQKLRLLSKSRNNQAVKMLNISTAQLFGSDPHPFLDYSTVSPTGLLNGMTLLMAAFRGFTNLQAIRITGEPSVWLLKQPRFAPAILPFYLSGYTSETHFQRVLGGLTEALRRSFRQMTHLYIQDEGIIPSSGPEHIIACFSWLQRALDQQLMAQSEGYVKGEQAIELQQLLDLQQTVDRLVSVKYAMSLKPRLPLKSISPGLQFIPQSQLCGFLSHLPRLARLSLTINNTHFHPGRLVFRSGWPYLDRFWATLDMPCLESLEIIGPLAVRGPFSRVIMNHIDTLRTLTLCGVRLAMKRCWVWLAGLLGDCKLERIVIDRPMILDRVLDIGSGVGRVRRVVIKGDIGAGLDEFARDLN